MRSGLCLLCGAEDQEVVFSYARRPEGETDFGIPPEHYRREFRRCRRCGHMSAFTGPQLTSLYARAYVDATYADGELDASFERIMSLPPERSDNAQRVRRIQEWMVDRGREHTLLDVGSGLGVFPAAMAEAGWRCTALDPDPRAADHAERRIGVNTICTDFMVAENLGQFSLITLNKVLEHVEDPVQMLARTRRFLGPSGTVYVEVPDGELAAEDPEGENREEFFIEHLHAFSASSLSLLVDRTGYTSRRIERIRDPSGKYTLAAFLE